ncbi:MAG: SMC-Scp complex subunit ScpB [Myxococcales bacterium]|jgi:segregation and condensation protein B
MSDEPNEQEATETETGVETESETGAETESETGAETGSESGAAASDSSPAPDDKNLGDPENVPEDRQRLKRVLESLIFVSDRIVTPAQLARSVKQRVAVVRPVLKELVEEYADRGLELTAVAGGYQFRSAPSSAPFVRDFVAQKPVRLTRAQLETLALVAYRQPITRPEIDEVRGVDSGSAVRVLLERTLIKILGRKDEPGRPLLYGTSPHFLEFFGMTSLKDLPTLREFAELTEENRALFKRKTGEEVEEAEAALAAAEEAAQQEGEEGEALDDDALEALAAKHAQGEAGDEAAAEEDDEGASDDSHAAAEGEDDVDAETAAEAAADETDDAEGAGREEERTDARGEM